MRSFDELVLLPSAGDEDTKHGVTKAASPENMIILGRVCPDMYEIVGWLAS